MDKERANFCGYFDPVENAWCPPDEAADSQARRRLEALFGQQENAASDERVRTASETDSARAKLEALFKVNDREK